LGDGPGGGHSPAGLTSRSHVHAAYRAATWINSGKYLSLVADSASTGHVTGTPTIRVNGEDYDASTPDALNARIQTILGDTPNL
jgi:hypothetical protein